VSLDVLGCGAEQLRVFAKEADALVTATAQEISVRPGHVIVVDMQPGCRSNAVGIGRATADRTSAVLSGEHRLILLQRHPIPTSQ
jgi:hypothetical protein